MPQTRKRKENGKKTATPAARRASAERAHKSSSVQRTADDLAAQLVPPILALVALFLVVCFISAESTGFFGSWLSDVLYGLFSNAAFTIPVLIIIIAAYWKHDYEAYTLHHKFIFAGICLVCVAALSQLGGPDTFKLKELWEAGLVRGGGGVIGGLVGQALLKSIGRAGMLLVTISLLIIFGLFLFGLTPHAVRIWIAFKMHENRERLRAERAEAQARKLHHNKPEVEPAVPVPVQNGGEQRRARGAYIYEEEDEGSEGDAQPADSGAEANAAADTEPAIDPAAFDAALRDSEYVPESADDAPPFDIPGMANDTVTEHIKPSARQEPRKNKRAPAPNRSSRPSPVCMRYSAKATTNLILSANSLKTGPVRWDMFRPTAAVRAAASASSATKPPRRTSH
jgi:hypothetical protein